MKKIKNNSFKNNQKKLQINGERIMLRIITISDVSDQYVDWLNSRNINQFLESRFSNHTKYTLRKDIQKILKDKNTLFFTIIDKSTKKHIGNIKLGTINFHHKLGEIGLMIGDENFWGQGYGSEAISLISHYAFTNLNLHKLTAGAYVNNTGSIRAFKKALFHEEGRRKKHFYFKRKYVDYILLAKFKK